MLILKVLIICTKTTFVFVLFSASSVNPLLIAHEVCHVSLAYQVGLTGSYTCLMLMPMWKMKNHMKAYKKLYTVVVVVHVHCSKLCCCTKCFVSLFCILYHVHLRCVLEHLINNSTLQTASKFSQLIKGQKFTDLHLILFGHSMTSPWLWQSDCTPSFQL